MGLLKTDPILPWQERPPGSSPARTGNERRTERRITRVVKAPVSVKAGAGPMNQTQLRVVGMALIVIAIALAASGMSFAKRLPRYEATAMVKVERDEIDLPVLKDFPELATLATPDLDSTYFIQTEIALLQSEATLNHVITNLDLNRVWGKRLYDGQPLKTAETLQMLKSRLLVQPGPEVNFITIRAAGEEAAEAAAIANTTARAYCDYRTDYRRRLTQNALDALAGKSVEMQQNIAAAREKVQQAGQQLDPALREQAAARSTIAETEALQNLRARYSESILRYLAKSNQLARYQPKDLGTDENIAQLKAMAEKAKTEMVAAESATRDELRKQEQLRTYQSARFELDELTQLFAPLQETMERLRNDLRPKEHAPAQIVEQASTPTVPDTREAGRGRVFLGSSGLACALGVALLLLSRKPKTSAT
jgi:uncharacterized protein involved in exopolysaccharide biosynthesis